jgi:hypothetical protein
MSNAQDRWDAAEARYKAERDETQTDLRPQALHALKDPTQMTNTQTLHALAAARGATLRASLDALIAGYRPEDIVTILEEAILARSRILFDKKQFYRAGELVDLVMKMRGGE